MSPVSLRRADTDDHPALERLWLMFRHDMSEFDGTLPRPDGTFREERLRSALTDPDWAPYLLLSEDRPAGLVFVRSLSTAPRVLNSFFVARGARGSGLGMWAAREVVGRHPGPWEVAFQEANPGAVRFWRRVATEVAGREWSEERRPVPGRPDVPHDVWISFDAPARPGT
ncbi:GNAT family N-acetyltransferase [Streptomyces sp. NPDC005438]|uniref:GNAT family N-acetyltransferase n=1 Tax=Streptomyces sp. NPDC005438 TaxID=3156880 RepID=UPI0033B82F47